MTIAEVADRIGEHICEQAAHESEAKQVCFGIEIILIMSIFILSALFLGGLMGLFLETVIALATALTIKFMLGGCHLSGFLSCLVYSICLILSSAGLSHFYTQWVSLAAVLSLVILDLTILILFPLLPSYRTLDHKQTLTRKFWAGVLVILPSLAYVSHPNFFCASLLIGFSMAIITISPLGIHFTGWLDKVTQIKKIEKEV